MNNPLDRVLSCLENVKRAGAGHVARCPAHDDKHSSLSVGVGTNGSVILKCHAGCATPTVVTALGLSMADLFPVDESRTTARNNVSTTPSYGRGGGQSRTSGNSSRRVVATYDYTDASGKLLYQSVRFEPKGFSQRRPDGQGGFLYSLEGVWRVLYRLPDVVRAIESSGTVYVVEGEKDADALHRLGLCATTNAAGAGKWTQPYTESLKGAGRVIILPDNDEPGAKHAQTVAMSCHAAGIPVRIVNLPNLPLKGDVSDWLEAGGTVDELLTLVETIPDFQKYLLPPTDKTDTTSESVTVPVFDTAPGSLETILLPVPRLTVDMLPAALRGWLHDAAIRTSVPLEYIVTPALVAATATVGRKIAIRPKKYDSWAVVPVLWGACVGRPGTLKTPATAEGLKPLRRLEVEARAEYEKQAAEFALLTDVREAQKEATKSKLKSEAKKPGISRERLLEIASENQEEVEEAPVCRRFYVGDVTTEKLGEILKENQYGVMLFRDELVSFFRTLDKQGHETDRGFYLTAWNGEGAYPYDRIGRGTIIISNPCVSLYGTIQPGPLAKFLRNAASGAEADGFASRLQLLIYPDPVAKFVNVDRYPDGNAKNVAFDVDKRLAELDPASVGAETDEDGGLPFLHFTPDAQDMFDAWREALENHLTHGNETPLLLMHLSKYRSLCPCLALLFHLADDGYGSVDVPALSLAIRWCDFLLAHARRIYQSAMDGDSDLAQGLATRIKASLPNPFTIRDVQRKGWGGLDSTETITKAVDILEDRGWVKTVEKPSGERGGRSTMEVWINPAVRSIVEEENSPKYLLLPTDKTDTTPLNDSFVVFVSTSPNTFPEKIEGGLPSVYDSDPYYNEGITEGEL